MKRSLPGFNLTRPVAAGILMVLACPWAHAAAAPFPADIASVGPVTLPVDPTAYADIRYVSGRNGSDASGDGSAARPWASLTAALSRVGHADENHRIAILVAAAVYDDGTVQMRSFVDLYGGFQADTWQRNIRDHETVIDGRHARRVVIGADDARIDGFVLRRGRADGPGGAILCDNTSPTITNNRIEDSFTLVPVGFRYDRWHQDGNRGGALACLYEAVPVVTNNVFSGNWTEIGDGGAIAFYGRARINRGRRARVENNVFVGNVSGTKDFAETRSSSGGAIACSHEASPEIRGNVIAHNRALGRSDAGGIYCEYDSSPRVERNWIVGNESGDDGGGFYTMRQGHPVVVGNLLAGNGTTRSGVGGVRISKEGRATIVGNVIVRNQSGGAIYHVDAHTLIQDNLIADNLGGPGIRYEQMVDYFQASRIENNRIVGYEGGAIVTVKTVEGAAAPILHGNATDEQMVAIAPHRIPQADGSALRLKITRARFDGARSQTALTVDAAALAPAPASLGGRAVHIGDFWSVVASHDGTTVMVWGDAERGLNPEIAERSMMMEVLPGYLTAPR